LAAAATSCSTPKPVKAGDVVVLTEGTAQDLAVTGTRSS
jgi:hypothetical protein